MGVMVAGYGVSHTAMMIRKYDPEDAQHQRVYGAFHALSAELEALAPDLIVMFASEHMKSFGYEAFPQICVGIGDMCTGWGDGGVASRVVPLAGDFAAQFLEVGVNAGFDLAFSANPRIDHGFMTPLTLLTPRMHIPIVPVWQNASTPPMSPLSRAAELGRLLRDVVDKRPPQERVVLLATGGLSHWVGNAKMGEINIDFDRQILEAVRIGALDHLVAKDINDVVNEAGNGAAEIRNWITVMAARPEPGTVLGYEPVAGWATGIGLARLFSTMSQ